MLLAGGCFGVVQATHVLAHETFARMVQHQILFRFTGCFDGGGSLPLGAIS